MYKSLFMVFAAFLLCAGMAMAEDEMVEDETADVVTVEFMGIAEELIVPAEDVVGAPTIWVVNVTSAEEGALCSDVISVTVAQALAPPWGFFDENVTAGDEVEVFGAYIEDETGCSVTLHGSVDYYFMPVAEEEVAEETEEVADETAEETTEEVTEETTEETTDEVTDETAC